MICWKYRALAVLLAAVALGAADAARAQGPQVTLVLSADSVVEGSQVTVHATLSAASSAATTITLSSSHANATFAGSANTLTIAAGATTSNSQQLNTQSSPIVGENPYTATISGSAANSAGIQQPAAVNLTVRDNGAKLGITPPGSLTISEDSGSNSISFSFNVPFADSFTITPTLAPIAASGASSDDIGGLISTIAPFIARPGDFVISADIVVQDNHDYSGDKAFSLSFAYSTASAAMRAALPEPPAPITVTVADDETGGSPAWQNTGDDDHSVLSVLREGESYSIAISSAGATLTDTAKIPVHLRQLARSYQMLDADNDWVEISHHAADDDGMDMPYAPGETDGGRTVRVCIFFEDSDGDHEGGPAAAMGAAFADLTQAQRLAGRLCSAGLRVQNTNQGPQGMPYLAHVAPDDASGLTVEEGNPTILLEGWHVMPVLSTDSTVTGDDEAIGPVTDADGLTDRIPGGRWEYSLQRAAAEGGPWSELRHSTDNSAVGSVVSQQLTQEDADLGWMRACIFYQDDLDTWEGGARATAAERLAGTLCTRAYVVNNVSTRPIPVNSTVFVSVDATESAPYRFKLGDFMYTDEPDNDALKNITFVILPAVGTLRLNDTDLSGVTLVPAADIPNLAYWPATGQSATDNYTSLRFTVQDEGKDSTNVVRESGTTSNTFGIITIALTPSTQTAASGAPTVSPAAVNGQWDEDVQLTAATSGITEPNGIDTATLQWQWQGATGGSPQDSDYGDITGADSASFAPLQMHVGMHIRACASFMDGHATPASAELCSAAAQVRNVNDLPTGHPVIALNGADSPPAQIVQGTTYLPGLTTAGSTMMDGDGIGASGFLTGGAVPGMTEPNGVSWQLSAAEEGPWEERKFGRSVSGHTLAYAPDTTDVGRWLRVCSFYRDNEGTFEGGISSTTRFQPIFKNQRQSMATVCSIPRRVANANDAPTGRPIIIDNSMGRFGTANAAITSIPEGTRFGGFRLLYSSAGGVVDADGLPSGENAIAASWQLGSTGGGWSELLLDTADSAPGDGEPDTFSFLTDRHLSLGSHIRVCLFYTDDGGADEGGPRATAAQREDGTLCSDPDPRNRHRQPPAGARPQTQRTSRCQLRQPLQIQRRRLPVQRPGCHSRQSGQRGAEHPAGRRHPAGGRQQCHYGRERQCGRHRHHHILAGERAVRHRRLCQLHIQGHRQRRRGASAGRHPGRRYPPISAPSPPMPPPSP